MTVECDEALTAIKAIVSSGRFIGTRQSINFVLSLVGKVGQFRVISGSGCQSWLPSRQARWRLTNLVLSTLLERLGAIVPPSLTASMHPLRSKTGGGSVAQMWERSGEQF